MARLHNPPALLGRLPSALASLPVDAPARDRERASFHPYRAWYKTAEWQAIRKATLLRDLYTCKMCGSVGGRLVADHRRPHRGDRALFFDQTNTQTLCKPCHDGAKQRLEQAAEWR